MSQHRVVVTGVGAISALGTSADELWAGLSQGRSGIGPIRSFDASSFPAKVAAEVKELPPGAERAPRTLALAWSAADEAAAHAKLSGLGADARFGVFAGGTVEFPEMSEYVKVFRGAKVTPEDPTKGMLGFSRFRLDAMASLIADHIGLGRRTRIAQVIENACASGGVVIGEAFRKLRHGVLDVALAVGATSWTNLPGITVYLKIGALSSEANPAGAFDAQRSGFVMGEGAGALVLETLESAKARGVEPLAEITGYGTTANAYRITDMPRDGVPLQRVMELALADAQRGPADVDYINAHGTATYINDMVETRAIKSLLGDRAPNVPISSNKSMLGHTVTASGALEAIACIYGIREGIVAPTANLHHADVDCDLDYVPNVARKHPTRVALSNSFGFGGHNCTLVIEAVRA